MIRTFTIATALAFAAPAFADPSPATSQALLKDASQAAQARQLLVHQGYINISALEKDRANRWSGTAFKDGKLVNVAVIVPPIAGKAATN